MPDDEPAVPSATPLLAPRDGLPEITQRPDQLAAVVQRFVAGTGPVAVDAERASGYRYGQRAYLVQLRRAGAGTALIDPIGCPDLSTLGQALDGTEWVLHAANQDLPCLAEIGMRPQRIFDTELAARLAGHARVGLGPLVEEVLGLSLEKGHSAADWSTRPLPESWLTYAALDVEVLVELRDCLHAELDEQGKRALAEQEFAAVVAAPPAAARIDPWRRTSGLHRVRGRRALAVVRELWEQRDQIARTRDVAPGRIVPDAALVAVATALPSSVEALLEIRGFGGRTSRRWARDFWTAIERAGALADSALPATALLHDGPPPARSWAERDPAAARRLTRAKAAVTQEAADWSMPVENLLTPDALRRLAWTPPEPLSVETVSSALFARGARPWQVELTAALVTEALAEPEPVGAQPLVTDE